MRASLFTALAAFGLALCAVRAEDGLQAAIRFFEDPVRRAPYDFIAWNQLADRYQRQLRRTGNDRFIRLMREAAEKSLEAVPAAQNPGGLAALSQAQLTAHRFAEARTSAAQLREIQPGKPRPLELLADALIELGDYNEAAKVCDRFEGDDGLLSAAPRLARLDVRAGRR